MVVFDHEEILFWFHLHLKINVLVAPTSEQSPIAFSLLLVRPANDFFAPPLLQSRHRKSRTLDLIQQLLPPTRTSTCVSAHWWAWDGSSIFASSFLRQHNYLQVQVFHLLGHHPWAMSSLSTRVHQASWSSQNQARTPSSENPVMLDEQRHARW